MVESMTVKTLVVIPARGGSKGIPGKNVRHLGGKPLIAYPIIAALSSKMVTAVVVTTDCDQIAYIARIYGAEVVMRSSELSGDDVPLDPVVYHAVNEYEKKIKSKFDIVLTIQATSPLLSAGTIENSIELFNSRETDTMLSVVDERHLSWTVKDGAFVPNYTKRLNRQYLPPNFIETGGLFLTKRSFVKENSRFGNNIELIEISTKEAIDIDAESDWWIAEKMLQRRKVLFRVDGDAVIGMGHIYRALQLAYGMIDHEVCFLTRADKKIGLEKIKESNFPFLTFKSEDDFWIKIEQYRPDIIINDILDTELQYIEALKEKNFFVVNFEDLGQGAMIADVVINSLYDEKYKLTNHYWGKEYYCLRDEFRIVKPRTISKEVKKILVTFGGTDPNNYTLRIVKLLSSLMGSFKIEVILGLGYQEKELLKKTLNDSGITNVKVFKNVKNICLHMCNADLIFTSAGRTVYEIASIGVPCIVLAQNNRELHHTFASSENGIVNLKLGYEVSDEEIIQTFHEMVHNYPIRKRNQELMLAANLTTGTSNVFEVIFSNYRQWEKANV